MVLQVFANLNDSMKPHALMQENGGSGAVQITAKLVLFAKDR